MWFPRSLALALGRGVRFAHTVMTPSISWMQECEEPARAPEARCDRCGRQGTIALVARGSPRPAVSARFCRRCWPAAHRRVLAERDAESAAFREAYARWAPSGVGAEPATPPGLSIKWHWSVLLSSLYRQSRHDASVSSRQAAP